MDPADDAGTDSSTGGKAPQRDLITWHIFVNPASGSRSGTHIWDTIVRPALEGAGWRKSCYGEETTFEETCFQVTFTKRGNHAADTVRELVTKRQTLEGLGFVCIGGDGVVHEVIKGVMSSISTSNPPSLKVPIAVIPAGTGNALATSLKLSSPEEATERLINYKQTVPLKISSVHIGPSTLDECPDEVLMYSFCVVSWGLHAQIVRQSETLRMLGRKRFQVAAMMNIALMHQYRGQLYLLDPTELSQTDPDPVTFAKPDWAVDEKWVPVNGKDDATSFSYFLSTKMSSLEPGFQIAPHAHPSTSNIDLVLAPSLNRSQLLHFLQSTPAIPEYIRYIKTRGFKLAPSQSSGRRTSWVPKAGKLVHDICIDGEMVELENGQAVWVKILDERAQLFNVVC
ncbi:uncharacterized protein SPPG_01089 [Spizellomyces punctatus DAOM BR117]|uniref:DAGKc domain-containing protein n=1 Tax=Spizellomyces punctatus (strain DAOM BR117) TaxID=645134 RepID=A0A0L0HRD9_SPIPD|nr:uncharacterized protein SPPG_01089 [Spizellomyces punctatus DAOM BR117]KND03613.1 hypothetical protein SPPG_01089 [Spizellomyces punctatus DAOM BR117]|eukprot:XP_016611652.1 hypothetical protein SPPG_01089 [Spizellomyces punctatus DAOM BR117]